MSSETPVYHPRSVHVRIASGCNYACNFCEREMLGPGKKKRPGLIVFQDGRPPIDLSKDMDLATWEKVAERLMPYTYNMELGGLGEPTMGEVFTRAARDIAAAGRHLFFFTNGTTLGSKPVIEAVQPARLRVSISLDAGTPEGYARIRGGDLAKVKRSIQTFKAEVPHAVLCSQFTATADNIEELPAFVDLCAELGIGRFDDGAEIIVAGAHHHVTDRATKSIRFATAITQQALDLAVKSAHANRLWLLSALPTLSDANPNALFDGSDPTLIRRYADRLLGATVCSTGAIEPPPAAPMGMMGAPQRLRASDAPIVFAPQQLYVDHTGDLWTCLARHVIGRLDDGGDWASWVENNAWYQKHLGYFAGRLDAVPEICQKCPNLA